MHRNVYTVKQKKKQKTEMEKKETKNMKIKI